MVFEINQKKIALGSKYEVIKDGIIVYKAASRLFRLFSEINLLRTEDGQILVRIKRLFSFFTAKYYIEMTSGSHALFYTVSFWKNHYRCEYRGKFYDVFGHKGRKFSIFKNNRQIAWFEKEAVSYFEGDTYHLIADADADVVLLISFVLIIDNYRSRNKGPVNFDIGNIFEARPFDERWQPRSEIPY